MSLRRHIRHRASRRQLAREVLFTYIVMFVFIFLDLHFVGTSHYYPSFHRDYLPVSPAAHQAILWALVGPVLWVLQEYALRDNETWSSFWGLDSELRGLVLGAAALMVAMTVVAWRWMLPLWGLVAAVALYLRFSRPKDSL